MGQAQINVRTRACSRTSIARTKQAALTHGERVKLIFKSLLPKCVLRPGRIIFNWSTLEHLGGQLIKCALILHNYKTSSDMKLSVR